MSTKIMWFRTLVSVIIVLGFFGMVSYIDYERHEYKYSIETIHFKEK